MVKIMRPVQNLSLRKSLVLYIVLFVMFALALSIMTASVCETVADKINEKYPNTGEKYYLTNEQGERLGEGTYIYKELPVLNEQDEQLLAILDLLPTVTPPIYSAFCIIAAALLFYKNKLKKPLAELRAASEKIANNDLDFSIDYDSNDELGQLCASFEIMRTTLVSDVEFIAEEIIMMKSGQIIHFGNPQEITSEIDGQVWECTVPTAYAEKYAAAYNTSNLRNISGNQTILRIIGDRPPMENVVRVQPTLEDLYLFYFKGGCEE